MIKSIFQASIFDEIRRMNIRQFLSFALIVCSALMLWKTLIVVSGSPSPIVVVLSGSMEPAFYRGDLLFLANFTDEPVRVGDIAVFKIVDREIPIVHRVLQIHEEKDGTLKFLTKGDNNNVDDRGLYAQNQDWLKPSAMLGRAKGYVPYIGMVTIVMNDYPLVKYAVLSVLAIAVFLNREN